MSKSLSRAVTADLAWTVDTPSEGTILGLLGSLPLLPGDLDPDLLLGLLGSADRLPGLLDPLLAPFGEVRCSPLVDPGPSHDDRVRMYVSALPVS